MGGCLGPRQVCLGPQQVCLGPRQICNYSYSPPPPAPQLQAVHAADARVITASDYTVLIEGVPSQLSAAELQEWCSHYGSGEGGRLLHLQSCDSSMPAVCLCRSAHLHPLIVRMLSRILPVRPDFGCAAAALPLLVFVLTVRADPRCPAALQWWAPSMCRMWATACGWRSACRCCWSGASWPCWVGPDKRQSP